MKKKLIQIFTTLCLTVVLVLPYFALAQVDGSGSGSGCAINPVTGVAATSCTSAPTNAGGVDSALGKLKKVGSDAGPYAAADETSLATVIGSIINVVLGLLGILFVIIIVVYGYKWMMAGGDEKAVESSKTAIKNAIIGIVVTVSAYAIWGLIKTFFA